MKSISSPLQSSFVALIAVIALSVMAHGQSAELNTDLSRSFVKFELVHLDTKTAGADAENGQLVSIPFENRVYEISLVPRDLRSPRYRSETSGSGGTRELTRSAVETFRGKVIDERNSEVRLTINDKKIEGFFTIAGEPVYIEPARKHSKLAVSGDYVIYRAADLIRHPGLDCDAHLAEKVERERQQVQGQLTPQNLRILEIATEADFELVNLLGGATAANNEILGLLNMVEGTYEAQLNLTFTVVYQHAWTGSTPFNGATRSLYLDTFKTYWNTNFPTTQTPRDVAFMYSGKAAFSGQGQSFLATVCASPLSAYGFSSYINSLEANRVLMAHEIGHTVGASHVEAPTPGCGDTIMNQNLSNLTPMTFCPVSQSQIAGHIAANGSCLDQQFSASVRFDFDGDRKGDVSVFRPSNGVWFINNSAGGFNIFQFGANGDKPVAADYDGDGRADGAVYRQGVWYRLKSSNNTFDSVSFGLATDIPAPADFDGDGKADIVVFRPSNGSWYSLMSRNNGFSVSQFGVSGDVPMAGDFDGDGRADINLFRPSNGVWYRLNSSNGSLVAAQFGMNGDKPVHGDFDGDGLADMAVWRPSTGVWYSFNSSNGQFKATSFGISTDIPVSADYDGDGKADISVFRPEDGYWHRLSSASGNSYSAFQFGTGTDLPVAAY